MTDTDQLATTQCYAFPRSHYVLTPNDWQSILAKLQDGYSIGAAARSIGATRQAVYERIWRDPAFAQAIKATHEEGIDIMEDLVREKAHALPGMPGVISALAWLKAHRRAKWGDHLETTSHSTLRIIIGPAPPTIEELRQQDARMALPMPDSDADNPYEVREPAEDGQYREVHDANDST